VNTEWIEEKPSCEVRNKREFVNDFEEESIRLVSVESSSHICDVEYKRPGDESLIVSDHTDQDFKI